MANEVVFQERFYCIAIANTSKAYLMLYSGLSLKGHSLQRPPL